MITAERVKELLKNKDLGDCPAKKISYALLTDSIRNIFSPYLASPERATKEEDLEWFFNDKYGKQVDRNGGCSFDFCCLSLDISHETLRDVVKSLLSSKKYRDKYLLSLYSNLYNYNNIYYNIYKDK